MGEIDIQGDTEPEREICRLPTEIQQLIPIQIGLATPSLLKDLTCLSKQVRCLLLTPLSFL